MRSGVIAQKVGMTRIFTDAGEHIPVTVLKLDNCQVVGHRTPEKNGYTALQLGAGTAQGEASDPGRARAFRRGQCRAQAQAGRVPREPGQRDRCRRGDHRRPFRRRPVCRRVRHHDRQGFCRRHEAPQLPRLAGEPRRVGQPPQSWLDRPAPGSGQGVQGQEDGRPYGRRERHHAEFAGGEDRSPSAG